MFFVLWLLKERKVGPTTGLPRNPQQSYIYWFVKNFVALKCLENKGFVPRGLKKVLIIWAANFSVEMCDC